MQEWILGIELNGEWEHCSFRTRREALASFAALTSDYSIKIVKAVLFRQGVPVEDTSTALPKRIYIN